MRVGGTDTIYSWLGVIGVMFHAWYELDNTLYCTKILFCIMMFVVALVDYFVVVFMLGLMTLSVCLPDGL